MPSCIVCGSESFDEIDSLYFCGDCGTQSQDFRDEKCARDDVFGGINIRLEVKQKSGKKEEKAVSDKGKPWLTYEAFQIILKAQVEALIEMGFNPKLKDIVGQLWFKYLQMNKIAFTGSQDSKKVDVGNHSAFSRDRSFCNNNKDNNNNNNNKKTDLRKMREYRRKRKLQDPNSDDDLELSSQLSSIDDDTDLDMLSEGSKSDDEDDKDEDNDDLIDVDLEHKQVSCSNKQKMRLRKTILFCYLGLRWLKEPVGLGDLMRWANSNCFPYYEAVRRLPMYMKISNQDASVFSSFCRIELSYEFWVDSLRFLNGLNLPAFPECDIGLFTCRYILDLNLPDCMHGIVNKLIKEPLPFNVENPRMRQIVYIEELAMGYIMIAAKLLYGLDDKTERELEDHAEHFDSENPLISSRYIYVWKDWVSFMKQCQSESMSSGLPKNLNELKHLRDAKHYSKDCFHNVFGRWIAPEAESNPKYKRKTKIAFKHSQNQEYAQVFSDKPQQGNTSEGDEKPVARTFVSPPKCSETSQKYLVQMKSRGIPVSILPWQEEDTDGSDKKFHRILHLSRQKRQSAINLEDFPDSLLFLLETCANVIECNPRWLAIMLCDLEERLFMPERKKLSTRK